MNRPNLNGAATRPTPRRPARGFAMLTALAAVAIVAASLLAIGALLVADARRTARAADEAQLRQLLLAGAAIAHDRARHWPDRPPAERSDVPLPPDLIAHGASLRIEAAPDAAGERIEVHVSAARGGRTQRQVLHYRRQDGAWKLTGAGLEPTGR